MKNKRFIVTMQLWHESFGGYNHRDGEKTIEVLAKNEESACDKAVDKVLNPGKGRSWSQSRWATDVEAVLKPKKRSRSSIG